MTNTDDLYRQGRRSEVWTKYCGFLDLDIDGFMEIQRQLLLEQLDLLYRGVPTIGKRLLGDRQPRSIEEFRKLVPVTTYEDYEPYLTEKRADVLPVEPYLWAHTSGRSGSPKWVPYTRESYSKFGERVLAGVILAAARSRGDLRIEPGDLLVYNTPPRPYVSGVALRALADQFNFRFVPGLDETEDLSFQERIEQGFATALDTGIDVLGSLAVVLVKMGERFAEGARTTKLSAQMLKPRVLTRLVQGWLRSKIEGRKLLPRDLWRMKAIVSGGMDTSIYRQKIAHYWGIEPYEQYGATEEGAIATQTWAKKGMVFFPDAAFLEFIPEEEWQRWRLDRSYVPDTVLLNEVEPNRRYEVVITNFYGKPLLRYRLHDIVQFACLEEPETGVKLPHMAFIGRSSDFIDLAGFTGLIDEKMVWQSIVNAGLHYEEWTMRKESIDGAAVLHLYIEMKDRTEQEMIRAKVHESLKSLNPYFGDYEAMIESRPLRVTVLEDGAFRTFMAAKQAAGADMAHLKPPHMNSTDDEIASLLRNGKNGN